mmetsp:Transcript_28983/g.89711  ORF Transcript_28983/g.89711 Transcript_28983/m.89711 type:complete len:140 (-) Transcript_28983:31-450(-)
MRVNPAGGIAPTPTLRIVVPHTLPTATTTVAALDIMWTVWSETRHGTSGAPATAGRSIRESVGDRAWLGAVVVPTGTVTSGGSGRATVAVVDLGSAGVPVGVPARACVLRIAELAENRSVCLRLRVRDLDGEAHSVDAE